MDENAESPDITKNDTADQPTSSPDLGEVSVEGNHKLISYLQSTILPDILSRRGKVKPDVRSAMIKKKGYISPGMQEFIESYKVN